MKVSLLPIQTQAVSDLHDSYTVLKRCLSIGLDGYSLCDSFTEADLIVLCNVWAARECHSSLAEVFESKEFEIYNQKIAVYNDFDSPIPNINGAYTSISSIVKSNVRSSAVPYISIPLHPYPEGVPGLGDRAQNVFYAGSEGPRWSSGYNVRVSLSTLMSDFEQGSIAESVSPWTGTQHNIKPDTSYVSRLTSSKIALCPRGVGNSSYRIYEALRCGAIPLIIADDWIRPRCVDADAVLQWSEKSITSLSTYMKLALRNVSRRQIAIDETRQRLLTEEQRCKIVLDELVSTTGVVKSRKRPIVTIAENRLRTRTLKLFMALKIVVKSLAHEL
jgi:hypothetical protein